MKLLVKVAAVSVALALAGFAASALSPGGYTPQKEDTAAIVGGEGLFLSPASSMSSVTASAVAGSSSAAYSEPLGIFKNDVDNYMSTRYYGSVSFDKLFTFINIDNEKFGLGAAKNFDFSGLPLYIGAWYEGNLIHNSFRSIITSTPSITEKDDGTVATDTEISTQKLDSFTASRNQFAFTVGLPDMNMGATIGMMLNESARYTGKTGNVNGGRGSDTDYTYNYDKGVPDIKTVYDPNGYYNRYTYVPYVGWGMNMDTGLGTLRPFVNVLVPIYSAHSYYKSSVTNYASSTSTETSGYQSNGSYVGIDPVIGARMDLALEGDYSHSVAVSYAPQFYIYTGNFTDAEGNFHGGYSRVWGNTNSVSETDNAATNTKIYSTQASTSQTFKMNNVLDLQYNLHTNYFENIELEAQVGLNMKFNPSSTTSSRMTELRTNTINKLDATQNQEITRTVAEPGTKTDVFTFELAPRAVLGAKFRPVPNKFTVKAGVAVSPVFSNTHTKDTSSTDNLYKTTTTVTATPTTGTTTTKEYEKDDMPTEQDIVESSWNCSFAGTVGMTFFFVPNTAWLDLAFTAGWDSMMTGLQHAVKLQAVFKFNDR